MTIEWIPVDCNLDRKAETLEIMEASNADVSTVVGRLVRFWSWASLETATGTVRMTVPRLCSMFGGDAAFWKAVETAGWLEVAEEAGKISIPGWEKRFSQAAKSRARHAKRAEIARAKAAELAPCALERTGSVRPSAPEKKRKDERRSTTTTTTVGGRVEEGSQQWAAFLELWNKGPGAKWSSPLPPQEWVERAADPGWITEAVQAVEGLERAKFFERSPVSLVQFLHPDFVRRTNGGHWDAPKPKAKGPRGEDGGPSAAEAAERWRKGATESAKRAREFNSARAATRDARKAEQ